jgi:hypothetical protein
MVVVAFFSYIFDGRGYMHTLCALTCLLLFFFFKGVREAGTVGYSPQRDARVAYRSEPIHSVE